MSILFEGDAENVKTVTLSFLTKTKFKDNAEAEDEFLKSCERIWFETFTMPLPEDVSKAILSDKGKAKETNKAFTEPTDSDMKTIKTFTEPTKATVLRHPMDDSYGLVFYFDLPAK